MTININASSSISYLLVAQRQTGKAVYAKRGAAPEQTEASVTNIERFWIEVDGLTYSFEKESDGKLIINVYNDEDVSVPPSWYKVDEKTYEAWLGGGKKTGANKSDDSARYESVVRTLIRKLKSNVLPSARGKDLTNLNNVITYLEQISE